MCRERALCTAVCDSVTNTNVQAILTHIHTSRPIYTHLYTLTGTDDEFTHAHDDDEFTHAHDRD